MMNRTWGRPFCDLSRARIASYKNTWKQLQDTVYWRNFLPAEERGLRCYQTRPNTVVLFDTLSAEIIEKAVRMKTKEQHYQRESEKPRVRLKADSQCESQDLPSQEARSSWETQSDAQRFRETRCNIVDYRIPDISLSTVQEQDERRLPTVVKLIEKFESHQHKDLFLKHMSQTQKINRFSGASQKLPKDVSQTEVFDLCVNTTKIRCPEVGDDPPAETSHERVTLFMMTARRMKTSLKSTSSKLCSPTEFFRTWTSPDMGSSTAAKGASSCSSWTDSGWPLALTDLREVLGATLCHADAPLAVLTADVNLVLHLFTFQKLLFTFQKAETIRAREILQPTPNVGLADAHHG